MWVPDEGSEALRDLVRAREAAKQDQTRARRGDRLSKFLLRCGQRAPTGVRPWTRPYLIWVAQLPFHTDSPRVHTPGLSARGRAHAGERVARLEQAIMEAVKLASPARQLASLTIYKHCAASLGDLGCNHCERVGPGISLWECSPAYGLLRRSTKQGIPVASEPDAEASPKTGNAHLRRIVVEAAWSYRRPPGIWYGLRRRQESISRRGERDCVEGATPTA